MQELSASDPLRGSLEEINTAGIRAADLTRQLLAFGRRQTLQPTLLNLNDILKNDQRMLRHLLGEDVEVIFHLDANLGQVIVDANQLEQVIMNLAVNARDAMPDGGVLTIETANVELTAAAGSEESKRAPGGQVTLSVSDNGVGMDAETQARAFEPFFTTKAQGSGTGLGLATVFGIVQQSGGQISVESTLGVGTTFKIHLPLAVAGSAIAHAPAIEAQAVYRGTETILLVEDEAPVRRLACQILRTNGYRVL